MNIYFYLKEKSNQKDIGIIYYIINGLIIGIGIFFMLQKLQIFNDLKIFFFIFFLLLLFNNSFFLFGKKDLWYLATKVLGKRYYSHIRFNKNENEITKETTTNHYNVEDILIDGKKSHIVYIASNLTTDSKNNILISEGDFNKHKIYYLKNDKSYVKELQTLEDFNKLKKDLQGSKMVNSYNKVLNENKSIKTKLDEEMVKKAILKTGYNDLQSIKDNIIKDKDFEEALIIAQDIIKNNTKID